MINMLTHKKMIESRNEISGIPDSRQEEYQILTDLISNPEYIGLANNRLRRDMFSDGNNAEAWDVLLDMNMRHEKIDLSTAGMRIHKGVIAEIMKPKYNLGICTESTVMAHCEALVQISYRRNVYCGAAALMQDAQNMGIAYGGLMMRVEEFVGAISGGEARKLSTEHISKVLQGLEDELEAIQNVRNSGRRVRIPTGFPFLDRLTFSGFGAGNLVILAARPSVGKTAVMLHMAKTAAASGFPACMYSLEMSNGELAQRILFSTGMITPRELSTGEFDWKNVEEACRQYSSFPLYFNDRARTVDDIVADIISVCNDGRCSIAFIDYLGLIRTPDARSPLYQIIAGITSRLKSVAMECRIPIVLLCQMNRDIERENRPPMLSDLRDSGSIEQDADVVLMLERESRSLDDRDLNVWVRKNRHGRAGDVVFGIRANDTFSNFEQRKDYEHGQDAEDAFSD